MLFYDFAAIVFVVYIMYGYAALSLAVRLYRFMHVHAVHALAAIFWQEGRVYVDDAVGIGGNEEFRQEKKKAGSSRNLQCYR